MGRLHLLLDLQLRGLACTAGSWSSDGTVHGLAFSHLVTLWDTESRLRSTLAVEGATEAVSSLLSVSQSVTRWLKARPRTVPSLLQLPAVQARSRNWREELQVQEEVEAAHSLALESWPTDRRRGEGEQG